jgi:tRNA dimethylallyltransferase
VEQNSDIRIQNSEFRSILVLIGPTASGKTAVSLPLAERLGAEIISADSRQVYKFMDIGTAKPTPAERARVTHHFIDFLTPDQDYSAGEFGIRGRELIEEIFAHGHVPLVVGGAGLYVQSLVDGFFDGPPADPDLRTEITRRFETGGTEALLEELRSVDPEYAAAVDPTKPRRIIRALEVFHVTGVPISRLHQEQRIETKFSAQMFGLEWPRPELYARIEQRCEAMIAGGLLDEAEDLVRKGYNPALPALNTVGYAEAFAMRGGKISREEMLRLFARNSRRYAKRQMTWFRRDARIRWIAMSEEKGIGAVVEEIVKIYEGQK